MKKFLRYSLKTWLLPPLFFFVFGSIPLIIAVFVGLDGFTFAGTLCFGVVGAGLGLLAHGIVASSLRKELKDLDGQSADTK